MMLSFFLEVKKLQSVPRPQRIALQFMLLLLSAGFISGCGTVFKAHLNADAQVSVSPSSVSWYKVAVGQTGGPKSATLTNTGVDSLAIKGVSLQGTNPGDFSIYKNTCGSALPSFASCTVTVLFKPTATGARSANLNFEDSSGNSPQQIALSGTGTDSVSGGSTSGTTATLSPTSISWASVNVGSAGGQKTATFANTGSSTIDISSIALTGTDASDFSIYKSTCGTTLAASASCAVTVLFKPTSAGNRTAALAFTDNATGSPQEVALSGLGVASGSVTALPSSLSFGDISVGGTSSAQSISLTNSTSSSVALSGAAISGTNAGDFAVSSTTCGSSLAASASCTTNVAFKPTASGARSATWTINDGSGTLSVALSGTGGSATATSATVSPSSITWASVAVGNTGGPKTATLTNSSTSTIDISNVGFTGTNAGDFAIYQQTCASTLGASASCTVTILFKPTASGTRTATLNFTDSAGNSPQQVSVSGLGTGGSSGSVTASPTSLSFSSTQVGSNSSPQTITVSNGTSSSVTLSNAGISGTNSGDFSVASTTCGSSLAASASCTANIVFAPNASGASAATWSITSSSSSTPLSVSLSGTGASTTESASVSPTSISWNTVAVGSAGGPKTATLTNSGGGTIDISSIAFTGTNAGDFSIYQKTCGSTLAASSSCTVTILFKPTASGTRTATLSFTDSAGNSPQQVSVTGLGSGGTSGSVTAAPGSLSFSSTQIGSTSSSQSVTLTNNTSNSITLSGTNITGTNAGDFSVASTTCSSTLAASASCTASIVFNPTASGTRTATLNFTDSASNSPQQVSLTGAGASGSSGTVTVSPGSLSFSSTQVGSPSSPQSVTLTNSTSSSVTLNGTNITGTDSGDFSVASTTCGSSLAAAASCTASIVFNPTASGTRTATLNFTDSAGNSPQQVSLTGAGAESTGNVTVSPASLNFGTVATGSASNAQSITITNSTSSSVTLSSAGISGTDASDFVVSTTNCGSTLAASASCTASITFKPTASGALSANWTITSSSSSTPLSVALSGTGTNSTIALTASPSSLTWGTVTFGQTSGSKTATLTNGGSAAVSINSIDVTGTDSGDFYVSANTCGTSLAASSSCTATVFFAPKGTGTRTATLSFSDAGSNSPQTITLSGTGGASTSGSVAVTPTKLTFPQTNTGASSSAMTVTLLNGSANSISISGVAIQGTDPKDFTESSTCGATLAASSSCTVSVTFAPTATGTRTATLTFTDSDSSSPQSVALTGVGASSTAGTATASPSSIAFGNFVVGQTSSTHTVTLKNNGSSTIAITGKSISGTNATDFAITSSSCGTSLGAYASCNIYLTFSPSGTGTRTATLSINDGASNSPQTVALSGTGEAAPTATITISPSSLAWGSQNVGVAAAAKTFTLTAGGSGTVNFSNFGFTGADAGDFSITANTCGTTLAQGSSCTVTVVFKPSAIGNRVALFSVTDDAIASPQTAEVSGTGANSTPQSASVTVDFGSRSGSQVVIPSNVLGTEYLESLPTNANRTTVVQGGFTVARYRLDLSTVYKTQTPSWGALDNDMSKMVAAGVHPLIELVNTPLFLQPSPSPCPSDPATSVPTDVNQWGQLVAGILAHLDQKFPGLVTQYEIWNEPDTTALCSSGGVNDTQDRLPDYLRIYAAAAPTLKAQAKTDGVSILVGGPATAGPAFPSLMTNSTTAPYVDFYSYHVYEGNSTDIKNHMTWDGAGGTPSLLAKVLDPSHGVQALYLQAYNQVKAGTTPLGANMPIYFDEYNDDWAFVNDCCRNSPTYSPLFNSITVAQLLNSVYKGAGEVPSMMIYYSAGQQTFCILGVIDSAMDCTKATTGAQAQPYPQWYTYRMIFNPSFLDLQDGGHMATSVTLSSSASSAGLIATGWYTGTKESVLIINPTATSFSGVTLQVNNSGLSSPSATLYTINAGNPTISQWPASTLSASGGQQITFDLPPHTVLAVSLH